MQPDNDTQPTGPTTNTDNQYPQTQPQQPEQGWQPAQPIENQQPATPASGQFNAAQQPANKSKKKKVLLIGGIIAAVALLGGGGAGAYFGLIVPNQPDKVWEHSLTNTATAYDTLVSSSQIQNDKKGGTFKGNFKYETNDIVVDGNIDSKFDEKNAVVKLDAGAAGARFTMDLLMSIPEGSKNPDLYGRVSGLKGIDGVLGAEYAGVGQALAAYDNQWYMVDHTYFDQLEKDASSGSQSVPDFTQQDIKAIADAVGKVNREYIFTTDETKAVLTKTQNVGKETFDNRDAYHFKVGYKKDKLKAYVLAMNSELKKTKLSTYLTDDNVTDITTAIDKLDDSKQADAWVDMKTKLIRNVRIVTNESKGETLDIGQKYNGGDEIPFFVQFTSKEKDNDGTASLLVTSNTKTSDLKMTGTLEGKESGSQIKGSFNGTLTASDEAVNVEKPADAKSILELVSGFMGAESQMIDSSSTL